MPPKQQKKNKPNPKKKSRRQRGKKSNTVAKNYVPNESRLIPKGMVRKQRFGPLQLSECALKFALACADGFHPKAFGVCNPAGKETYTQKAASIQRLTLTIGSGGQGNLLIMPGLASDSANIFYTGSTYAASGSFAPLSANNTLVTGVSTNNPTTPYTTSQLANVNTESSENVTGRVVSVTLKVYYTGTTLNKGGMYFALVSPEHSSLSGLGPADVGTFKQALIRPVDDPDHPILLVTAYPLDDTEDQFAWQSTATDNQTNLMYPFNGNQALATQFQGTTTYTYAGTGGVNVGSPVIGLCITSTAGNTFQVEIIQHMEYTGKLAQNMITRAHTDVVGANIVRNAIAEAQLTNSIEPRRDPWQSMYSALQTSIQDQALKAVPKIMDGVARMLM